MTQATFAAAPVAAVAAPTAIAQTHDQSSAVDFERSQSQTSQWLSFLSAHPLQTKLTIGAVNDPLEREADAAADRVMRMADPAISRGSATPSLSRKCASCEEDAEPLRRVASDSRSDVGVAPPIVDSVVNSSGSALDPATQDFMESGFGADFSDVRIHTDPKAAQSAAAVGALAYTVGSDVVFGAGQYDPVGTSGRRLLAHELAHVVQQGSGSESVQRLASSDCGSAPALPLRDSCTGGGADPRSGVANECFSRSFSAREGTVVNFSVTVDYTDTDCTRDGEDFRVQLWQCHTLIDEVVKDFGVNNIGSTMTDTASIPGTGWFSSDKFYIRVISRSRCPITATISAT